jgi:hypothetical protein
MGLGTGGYGLDPLVGYNGYPECWAHHIINCDKFTEKAINSWFDAGGVRLDNADSYYT